MATVANPPPARAPLSTDLDDPDAVPYFLWDEPVTVLERAGYPVESVLELAMKKDGGFTPGQLAWVLSEVEVGDDAEIPGGVSPAELRSFIEDLQRRLTGRAFSG